MSGHIHPKCFSSLAKCVLAKNQVVPVIQSSDQDRYLLLATGHKLVNRTGIWQTCTW